MLKGYVLVRFKDEEVLPAVVCGKEHWVCCGEEVMLDERGETAIAVTTMAGLNDPEAGIKLIAGMFHRDPDKLPRIIGTVRRDYWEEEAAEEDWRKSL